MISFEKFFYEKSNIKDIETDTDSDNPYLSLVQELKESAAERSFFKTFIEGKLPCAREFIFDKKTKKYRGDFAFPDKKIVIEINGPQHYVKERSQYRNIEKQNIPIIDSGKNDDYSILYGRYKDRHEYIKNLGWRVIEIPSWYVNQKDKIDYFNNLIGNIKNIQSIEAFDYDSYIVPMKVSVEDNDKNIKLLDKLLKDGKSVISIAQDIKRFNRTIKTSESHLSKVIGNYAKDHGLIITNSFSPEQLAEINRRIQAIPNKETMTPESIAKQLKYVSATALRNYLGKDIDEWRSKDFIEKGERNKGFSPEQLDEINRRIQAIPNKETMGPVAIAKQLKNISAATLRSYLGKGIDEWRSEDFIEKGERYKGLSSEELSEINRRIQSIPNKKTMSPESIAKQLKNISADTLKKYLGNGIDEWRSKDSIEKSERNKPMTPQKLAEINRRIQAIPNKETMSHESIAKQLKNISSITLRRYLGRGIDEWRSKNFIEKDKRSTRINPVNPHVESFKTFLKYFHK